MSNEYKQVKGTMEQLAIELSERHKQAFETWSEGGISKFWFDANHNLCIQYESGRWWRYNTEGEWF